MEGQCGFGDQIQIRVLLTNISLPANPEAILQVIHTITPTANSELVNQLT